jgi:hypothetical protein
MQEVKHYKVKVLPTNPRPNSVYYVKNTGDEDVTTFITDLNGVPVPLVDTSGAPVGDKNYVHIQLAASNVWEIQHNLDKFVAVFVVDSGESVVIGDIEYNDTNKITIRFQASFSGKAYLN